MHCSYEHQCKRSLPLCISRWHFLWPDWPLPRGAASCHRCWFNSSTPKGQVRVKVEQLTAGGRFPGPNVKRHSQLCTHCRLSFLKQFVNSEIISSSTDYVQSLIATEKSKDFRLVFAKDFSAKSLIRFFMIFSSLLQKIDWVTLEDTLRSWI